MNRIAVIFGTRPEAIKLAPVIMALRNDPRIDCRVCVTAQHRQMLVSRRNAIADRNPSLGRHNVSIFTREALSARDA